jgi:serine/threonine protein kinase
MNNILDIKNGLEIIGPIKTEGHASVYKGQRSGNLLSAVRLFPKPVYEGKIGEDQLTYINLELLKLERLGKSPHENVVTIVDTGISKAGNSFYIEMEFISGPDLEKLLQIPDRSIFTIKETLSVVEQLSNAIDHCHRMKVIHGSLKTSNIKRNSNTGNYVVVNFGSSIMPEQQWPASLPDSGSLEIIPPEQQAGKLLYQSDIYGFGLILFRLLAGSLPSIVQNNPLAESVTLNSAGKLPDLLSLRKNNIPSSWTNSEKEQEKLVPDWLVNLIYKCLETNPEKRFSNGMQIREYINLKTMLGVSKQKSMEEADNLLVINQKLLREKEELQSALAKQELNDRIMYRQWKEISEQVSSKDSELKELKQKLIRPVISVPVLSGLIVAIMLAGAFTSYFLLPVKTENEITNKLNPISTIKDTIAHDNSKQIEQQPAAANPTIEKDTLKYKSELPLQEKPPSQVTQKNIPELHTQASTANTINFSKKLPAEDDANLGEYTVKSKAYFHNQPDENTRRNAFIVHWNNAVLKSLDEQQGFIYVVFTNHLGQTSKGWLNKNDLVKINW